jgi:hypothetical protein
MLLGVTLSSIWRAVDLAPASGFAMKADSDLARASSQFTRRLFSDGRDLRKA